MGCKGTEEEWIEGFSETGETCPMCDSVFICPECSRGLINPTYNGTIACDKCTYEVPYDTFEKEVRYSKEYIAHCEKVDSDS